MTTIVFDGKTLASDSQTTVGARVMTLKSKKIFKLDNNKKYKAVGFSGDSLDGKRALIWFNGDMDESSYPTNLDCTCIAITHKNKIHIYYDYATYLEHPESFCAIGSGSDFAIAAIMAGSCASDAVKVAIKMDIYSGGKIQAINLDNKSN